MMPFEVTSEIYDETDYCSTATNCQEGNVVSKFKFNFPLSREKMLDSLSSDQDGDLIVVRKNEYLEIGKIFLMNVI